MAALTTNSLLHLEDLTLPQFQVIVMTANMGCAQCRERVYEVISKTTGLREYTVDMSNRQVIVKADLGFDWNEKDHPSERNGKKKSLRLEFFLKYFIPMCLTK
ncbi:hypothetical protein SLE2022_226790 [Rubroshorea leprosula]